MNQTEIDINDSLIQIECPTAFRESRQPNVFPFRLQPIRFLGISTVQRCHNKVARLAFYQPGFVSGKALGKTFQQGLWYDIKLNCEFHLDSWLCSWQINRLWCNLVYITCALLSEDESKLCVCLQQVHIWATEFRNKIIYQSSTFSNFLPFEMAQLPVSSWCGSTFQSRRGLSRNRLCYYTCATQHCLRRLLCPFVFNRFQCDAIFVAGQGYPLRCDWRALLQFSIPLQAILFPITFRSCRNLFSVGYRSASVCSLASCMDYLGIVHPRSPFKRCRNIWTKFLSCPLWSVY